MSMRVALVCPYFHPHIGGVESHVLALSRELVKKGHRTKVFTSNHDGMQAEEETVGGVEVRRSPVKAKFFQTPLTPGIVPEIQKERWDVIHSHSPPPMTSFYAARASKLTRTPLVHTHHCDPEIPSLLGRMVTWFYYRTLLSYTLRRSSRILVYTESYAATSFALWKFPTVCVPTGLDLDRFGPGADGSRVRKRHGIEGRKVVLFVGRMTAHKGIQTLMEAAAQTRKDTVFLLVGPGAFPAAWARRMRQLGIEDRFLPVGKVAEEELPAYYSASDLLVLPSVSRLEAFGLVLVEAMASGKPVVASDLPGVRDVIRAPRTGLLCEPFSDRDLARKIMAILSDEALAAEMGRAGRRLVEERYSWEVIGRKIEKVYEEVISEKGRGGRRRAR